MNQTVDISPTQIETWNLCKRKFAFTYLCGLARPASGRSQLIGISLHNRTENYLKTGQLDYSSKTPEEQLAAGLLSTLLPFLPPVGTPSEQKLTFDLGGVRFSGKFDWFEATTPEVGDLKTTSDFSWMKSVETLQKDTQSNLYAYGAAEHFNVDKRKIKGRWVYVRTKGKPVAREQKFTPDFSALDKIVLDGHNIVKAWSVAKPKGQVDIKLGNEFPANTAACRTFGGCPFAGNECNVSPMQRLIGLAKKEKEQVQNFDELIAGLKGANTTETVKNAQPTTEVTAQVDLATLGINPPLPAQEPAKVVQHLTSPPEAVAPEEPVPATVRSQSNPAAVGTEPQKAKRGRPRKNPEATVQLVDDPTKPIGILYIGCRPDNYQGEEADIIFQSARGEINEKMGVEDYRFIDYKGNGVLLACVEERIKALRPSELVVDKMGPEATVCLSSLRALAKRVIRSY